MSCARDDLRGIYRKLESDFEYFYAASQLSHQNDSVFDDIFKSVKYVLVSNMLADKRGGIMLQHKIDEIFMRWKWSRDNLRSRGAALNRAAIPYLKREVLKAIEEA